MLEILGQTLLGRSLLVTPVPLQGESESESSPTRRRGPTWSFMNTSPPQRSQAPPNGFDLSFTKLEHCLLFLRVSSFWVFESWLWRPSLVGWRPWLLNDLGRGGRGGRGQAPGPRPSRCLRFWARRWWHKDTKGRDLVDEGFRMANHFLGPPIFQFWESFFVLRGSFGSRFAVHEICLIRTL